MMVMYSCSSDDEKDSINPTDLIGKWEFERDYVEVKATPNELKEYIENNYLEEDYGTIKTLEFYEDGTGSEITEYLSVQGHVQTVDLTYTIKANILTIKYIYGKDDYDIITYEVFTSKNSLTMKTEDSEYIDKEYYGGLFPNGKITKLDVFEVFTKK